MGLAKRLKLFKELLKVSMLQTAVKMVCFLALFADTSESSILALSVNTQEPAATAPLLNNVLCQESIDTLVI